MGHVKLRGKVAEPDEYLINVSDFF